MTDSGDGGKSGGDELPCATEGKGGQVDSCSSNCQPTVRSLKTALRGLPTDLLTAANTSDFHFLVVQIPVRQIIFSPSNSSPAISTPAMLSVNFQFCNVHLCDVVRQFLLLLCPPPFFGCPSFSSLANSSHPYGTLIGNRRPMRSIEWCHFQ